MAKQSGPQKETMERVMHEWKHGELKDTAGDPVTDRRQAVAIGLSEAGASDRQTPAQNRRRLRQSKAKERRGETGQAQAEGDPTKAELYAEAAVPEYWVIDLPNRRLLVFRDPAPLPVGGHTYRTHLTPGPADAVSPLAAPAAVVKVADLLP